MGLAKDIDLSVKIGALRLPNPVGVASGTFGYGGEYEKLMKLSNLGALYTKAVTMEARPGNAPPRIVETPAGMLNSIGLANPGIEAFVGERLPQLRSYGCPVIVNVAGSSEGEYLSVIERLDDLEGVDAFELNLSCPNVHFGGLSFGTEPSKVESITSLVRLRSKKPLIVKLSPNVTDIAGIAKAAEAGGADGLSCVNTLVGMVIDVKRRRPVLAMGTGGLSGPAIRPVALACVYKVSRAVSIPVVGLGGICSVDDALQFLLAGASAIQVGTATFIDPGTALRILDGIVDYMRVEGIGAVSEFPSLLSQG